MPETEFRLARHDEVLPGIRDACPQPFRVEAVVDGILRKHIPDKSRLWHDGRREVVDVKRDRRDFQKPDGEMQVLLGSAAATALGWEYTTIVLASLGDDVLNDNIDLVQSYRLAAVTENQRQTAVESLANGALLLGTLADHLDHDRRRGLAVICALMVHHILVIDLTQPLSRMSVVRAAPVPKSVLPSIRL